MNILLLTYQGGLYGSTNSIAFLADALARRGHGVYVGCPKESILFGMVQKSAARAIPMVFAKKLDFDTMRHIRDIVERHDIDIINAQSSKDRYAAIFARWKYRLPVKVVHTRRQTPRSSGGFIQRLFYVKGTDAIVLISPELKRTFVKKGYPAGHLHVAFNGTPRERYSRVDPAETARLREVHKIGPDEIIIGCVSRRKKQEQLIDALPLLDSSIRVMFVGVEPGLFDQHAQRRGVRDRIIYAGIVDNTRVLNYYPLFAVNVLCSITEGFGLTLVESMALGVPVVGTRAEGIIDVVHHEQNGLLYDNGDFRQLARAITRLLDDEALRKRCIEGGVYSAYEEFSMEKTAETYERLFTGLLTTRCDAALDTGSS
jgi:glycosyltransferase involved in cell wall biosynthesis